MEHGTVKKYMITRGNDNLEDIENGSIEYRFMNIKPGTVAVGTILSQSYIHFI